MTQNKTRYTQSNALYLRVVSHVHQKKFTRIPLYSEIAVVKISGVLIRVEGNEVWVFNPFTFSQQSGRALLSGQVEFLAGNCLWWLVLVNQGVSKVFWGHGEGRICSRHQDEYVLLKRWWWYWCMLCYICMYMESDPKPNESRHCH